MPYLLLRLVTRRRAVETISAILGVNALFGYFPATVTAATTAEAELVATYTGGNISRADVDKWVEVVGEGGSSRVPSLQVESLAIARHLAENSNLEDDVVVEMAMRKIEAEYIRGYYFSALNKSLRVDPDEIEKSFQKYAAEMGKPERIRLRNIFKSKSNNTPEENEALRNEMTELRNRVLEGADMKLLALEESDSANRFDEGMVGTVARGTMPPALEERIFSLKENEISPVIESKDGFHIFRCEKKMDAVVLSEEEKRSRIETFLQRTAFKSKWEEKRRQWIEGASLNFDAVRSGDPDDTALILQNGETFSVEQVDALLAQGKIPFDPKEGDGKEQATKSRLSPFIVESSAASEYLTSHPRPDLEEILNLRRIQITADREFERRLSKSLQHAVPTEDEIREAFEKTKARLKSDPEFLIETFIMRIENDSLAKDNNVLKAFRERLANDPSLGFLDAAKELPPEILERSSVKAPHWRNELQIRAELGRAEYLAIETLKPGQVSPPVQTRFDGARLSVIRLCEIREPRAFTFEESKPGLTDYLTNLRTKEIEDSLKRDILKQINFATDP